MGINYAEKILQGAVPNFNVVSVKKQFGICVIMGNVYQELVRNYCQFYW